MALQLVPGPDYSGENGVIYIQVLQQDLTAALNSRDWSRLRRLDQTCGQVIEKVIAANRDTNGANKANLVVAINELKNVYATLIKSCHQEAAAIAI